MHRISISAIDSKKFLFLPFEQLDHYFGQSGGGARTFSTAAGGVVLPVVVPHWEPSVLKWLNPSHYGGRHYLYYCKAGLGKHPYLAQELTNFHTVLFFKTSGTPAVTFLQGNACKFR